MVDKCRKNKRVRDCIEGKKFEVFNFGTYQMCVYAKEHTYK